MRCFEVQFNKFLFISIHLAEFILLLRNSGTLHEIAFVALPTVVKYNYLNWKSKFLIGKYNVFETVTVILPVHAFVRLAFISRHILSWYFQRNQPLALLVPYSIKLSNRNTLWSSINIILVFFTVNVSFAWISHVFKVCSSLYLLYYPE